MQVDIKFINTDTEVTAGRTIGSRLFVAFSPYPTGIKSKAKWLGLSPQNEGVARTLAAYFTQIADQYAKDKQKPAAQEPKQ